MISNNISLWNTNANRQATERAKNRAVFEFWISPRQFVSYRERKKFFFHAFQCARASCTINNKKKI